MKQTATEYLFEKFWQMPKDKFVWQHYLNKAKKMEKDQIMKAYDLGAWEVDCIDASSEEYYKENYEQK